jgi:hypothetical protein
MIDMPNPEMTSSVYMQNVIEQSSQNLLALADGLKVSFKKNSRELDPLYDFSLEMVNSFKEGFSWKDCVKIINQSLNFIKENQNLTLEQQKEKVNAIMGHIIDLTDTPYLPDSYTDPIFKAAIAPVIDFIVAMNGEGFEIIPTLHFEEANGQTFKAFVERLKQTYGDGFQWSDLTVYLKESTSFVLGFKNLSTDEMKSSLGDIINTLIDITDTPFLPDTLVDPVLKAFTTPLVESIFSSMGY